MGTAAQRPVPVLVWDLVLPLVLLLVLESFRRPWRLPGDDAWNLELRPLRCDMR
jgi:hypothetical protein